MPRRPPGLDESGPAFKLDVLPKLGDHDEYHPPPKSAADALPVSQITDQIFIGSVKDLSDLEKLKQLGITHILNVAKEVEMITQKKRSRETMMEGEKNTTGGDDQNQNSMTKTDPDAALASSSPMSNANKIQKSPTTTTTSNKLSNSNPLEEVGSQALSSTSADADDAAAIAKIMGGNITTNNTAQDQQQQQQQQNDPRSIHHLSPGAGAARTVAASDTNTVTTNNNRPSNDLNALVGHDDDAAESSSRSSTGSLDSSSASISPGGGMAKKTSVLLENADDLFEMKHIPLRDGVNNNTMDVIDSAVDYVANAIGTAGGAGGESSLTNSSANNNNKNKIMVHCRRGISRSAAVVVAYLMEKKNMKYDDALKLVKSQRAVVSLNLEFRMNLSSRCEAKNGPSSGHGSSCGGNSPKQPISVSSTKPTM